jgi:hypothetical protein
MPPYSISNSSHNLINSPIIPIMENMKPIMEFAENFQIPEFEAGPKCYLKINSVGETT